MPNQKTLQLFDNIKSQLHGGHARYPDLCVHQGPASAAKVDCHGWYCSTLLAWHLLHLLFWQWSDNSCLLFHRGESLHLLRPPPLATELSARCSARNFPFLFDNRFSWDATEAGWSHPWPPFIPNCLFLPSFFLQFFSLVQLGLTLPSVGGRFLLRKTYSHNVCGTFLTYPCHWTRYRWPLSHPSSAFWFHCTSSLCDKGRRLIVMDLGMNPELLPESCTRTPGVRREVGRMLFRVSEFSLTCLMVKPWRFPIMAIFS